MTISGRPVGVLPRWATDEAYPSDSDPWAETPTKQEPGSGRRALGFEPGDRPPAQHLNQLLNELTEYVQYFSAAQAQNWTQPVESDGDVDGEICWDALAGTSKGKWFTCGLGKTVEISQDGWHWLDNSPGVGGTTNLVTIASKPTASGGFVITGGDDDDVYEYINGSWTTHSLPTTFGTVPEVTCIRYISTLGLFILGGSVFSVNRRTGIWTTSDGSTYTARTLNTVFANTEILDLAGGEIDETPIVAAIADMGPGVDAKVWTSANGTTWSEPSDMTGLQEPVAIAFSQEEECFLITTLSGQVWRSTDGTTWAMITATGYAFGVKLLVNKGSLWIAGSGGVGTEFLFALGSTATEWYRISSNDLGPLKYIAYGDGRFMAFSHSNSLSKGFISSSMRLGQDQKIDSP